MNFRKIRLLLSMFIVFCSLAAVHGQSLPVTGVVTNKKTGEPLAGASITLKGTTTTTVTDTAGSYSISVPAGSTLVVSFTGLATLERPVSGSGAVNFELSENESGTLDDVVVVGYGQQRRNNLTGSI